MDELNDLNRKIDALGLTDFERESLIPMMIDRMKFYLESFKSLLPICENSLKVKLDPEYVGSQTWQAVSLEGR